MYVIIESYLVTVLNPEMVNNSSEHCANLNAGIPSTKGQSTKKVRPRHRWSSHIQNWHTSVEQCVCLPRGSHNW